MKISDKLTEYVDFLLDYNRKINLISRQITPDGLKQLLDETFLLNKYLTESIHTVVDAGSGNGLLGIPIAILNENKNIVLVEPKQKKSVFLREAKEKLGLKNVRVENVSVEEYLKKSKIKYQSLIARGFPQLKVFGQFLQKGLIFEAILITSDNKIKKNQIYLESVKKKTYNVPLRKNLKILKMEKAPGDKHNKN